MNSGTQAAEEAENMVDLDSNPTKSLQVVEVGKQMIITRGALTTLRVANDIAKYFRDYSGPVRRDTSSTGFAQHHALSQPNVSHTLGRYH